MQRAKSTVLSEHVQKWFAFSAEDSKGTLDFKHQYARTTLKQMCTSDAGVRLWNSVQHELKSCTNIFQFKKIYKERVNRQYSMVVD